VKKNPLLVGMIGLVGLTATTGAVLVSARSDRKDAPETAISPSPKREIEQIRTSSPPNFRPEVTEMVAKAERLQEEIANEVARQDPVLHSEAELVRYLDTLEEKARTKGRVSAMEVEPGLRALNRLEHDFLSEEQAALIRVAFTDRMAALSRSLDPAIAAKTAMVVHPNIRKEISE
jgi:hypothetical protein